MRKLTDVIDAIIYIIPAGHDELTSMLTSIKESSSVAAPEVQWEHWTRVFDLLVSEISDQDEDWKIEAGAIFSGKEIERGWGEL